ncbi:uncharacterized protein [Anabrus simplex]|uniref:uncharacterized protein n=1 Tax=Anabrus simplex TaxID=316456 RepID=UPI0035A2E3CF
MVVTPQQRAQCVIWYAKFSSVVETQRAFRRQYNMPHTGGRWHDSNKEEDIRQAMTQSPRKSLSRLSAEQNTPYITCHRIDLVKAEAQKYKDIIQQKDKQLDITENEVKKLERELAETKKKSNSTPLKKTEELLNPSTKVETEMSPKSILKTQGIDANVSRKRVAFEDWSDTTDDSSVDINSYFAKKDNRKKSTSINGSDKERIFQSHPEPGSKKVCPDVGKNLSQYSKTNSTTYQMKKNFIRNNSAPKKFVKKPHNVASDNDDLFA